MNKSDILRALEWIDQAARDGDAERLLKAKKSFEDELASSRSLSSPEVAYKTAYESFVRKHGREPMEESSPEE